MNQEQLPNELTPLGRSEASEESPTLLRNEDLLDEPDATSSDAEEELSPLDQAIVEEKYQNTQLLNRIRGLRERTDSLYLTTRVLPSLPLPLGAPRYVSLAITALETARMFMGVMLREKGSDQPPYPADGSATQRTEQGMVLNTIFEIEPLAKKLNWLREVINDEITEMDIYIQQVAHLSVRDFIAQNGATAELMKGKMYLGMALSEVNTFARTNQSQNA